MPAKYMIQTKEEPNRFKTISKYGIITWSEGCLRCPDCVKRQCIYDIYKNRALDITQMVDSIDNQCMSCLRCVQGCPMELFQKSANPEYQDLGDEYWKPETITGLWYQAETGKIPVSGAGYPGPFTGPGFDSMWTDMSEIVRPTRDGIHGREYISTGIDMGGTPPFLSFDGEGETEDPLQGVVDIPLPVVLKIPDIGSVSRETLKGWVLAAKNLGIFLLMPGKMFSGDLLEFRDHIIPRISGDLQSTMGKLEGFRMVEITAEKNLAPLMQALKEAFPSMLVSCRIPLKSGFEEEALSLLDLGISVINLEATRNGRDLDGGGLFIKDCIRRVHLEILKKGVRDRATILAGGGIAMAEHAAKSIICGADGVVVDLPILIALECRMCMRCVKGLPCPVEIEKAGKDWVEARVRNLLGAWHNQLLEVMGAMGIRDVRRLRGETGRAIFFEDLDRETFGSLNQLREGHVLE